MSTADKLSDIWIKQEIADAEDDDDDDEMDCPINALKDSNTNVSYLVPIEIEIPLLAGVATSGYVKKERISDSEDDLPISRLNNNESTTTVLGSDDDSDAPLTRFKPTRQKEVVDEDFMISESGQSSDSEMLAKKASKKRKRAVQSEYVCDICGADRKNRKWLDQHMRSKHGEKYTCHYCGLKFEDKEQYKDHRTTHTGDTPYQCILCTAENQVYQFTTKSELNHHNLIVHGFEQPIAQKLYHCHLCNKSLKSQGTLSDHMKLHSGDKPVTCTVCEKQFTRDRDLKLHMNLHNESWKCNVCDRCFVTSCKLREHFRTHSGERPFECTKCDRSFVRAADYRYHAGTHLGLKPFVCEICDQRFTTSSSVNRHKSNMHPTTPRNFRCPICDKTFFTGGRLKTHIKNHDRSKRISCEHCPIRFVSQTELRRHLKRKHVGRFPCDVCELVCETPQQFEVHMEKHNLRGKPYMCNVCSYGYKSYQGLARHIATAHKDQDVPKMPAQHLCVLCGQVFDLKDKLNRHLKEEHIVLVVGELEILDETDPEDDVENKEHRTAALEIVNIKTEPPDFDGDDNNDDLALSKVKNNLINNRVNQPTDLSSKSERRNGVS